MPGEEGWWIRPAAVMRCLDMSTSENLCPTFFSPFTFSLGVSEIRIMPGFWDHLCRGKREKHTLQAITARQIQILNPMVDSTRGCDALLGYVYFGKPVPHLFFPFHLCLNVSAI
jgi:hypothetical protein